MKRIKIASLVLGCVTIGTVLTGCGESPARKTVYDLPHYDGSRYAEESELPDNNEELWYHVTIRIRAAQTRWCLTIRQ